MKLFLSLIATVLSIFFGTLAQAAIDEDIDVLKLQKVLSELCHDPGPLDGEWGRKTERAVTNLFKKNNLEFDGYFGENDQKSLYDIYKTATKHSKCKPNERKIVSKPDKIIWTLDENTRPQDYSRIQDPTKTFEQKVHRFQISSKCGSRQRGETTDIIGKMESSDCGENSVRAEIVEDVWEDSRAGETQPTHRWYSWNVYLPNDYPIQNTGKLLLGQFHNRECPHLSFTSNNEDNGKLFYETMKLWKDDCKETVRKQITSIQEMRGKWTNFTLEMLWKNDETGIANLWLDGKQVLSHRGRTLTLQKENTNYLKVGIYQCCNDRSIPIIPATAMFTTPKLGPTRESVE